VPGGAGRVADWLGGVLLASKKPEVRRKLVKLWYAFCALAIAAAIIAYGVAAKPRGYWPIVIAAILGVLLAIAELVSRYRDDPATAVLSAPAAVYVIVNAGASAGALYLLHVFNWTFGLTGTPLVVTQVLTAGFGSAALFRSSLFNVATGDQNIGIGPSALLNVILKAADRAVDRQRAVIRAAQTRTIMKGLRFDKGAESLWKYCVAAMQNITPAEAKAVENKISELRDPEKNRNLPDAVKSYILGLELLTLVGHQVLGQASAEVKDVLRTQEQAVLDFLKRNPNPIPIQTLQVEFGLAVSEVASLLKDLMKRGKITIKGDSGHEVVTITSSDDSATG
jgi:predicted transcriptional regulator